MFHARVFLSLAENHYVYNQVENEDSLHIYIKSKDHGCAYPICGEMSIKLHFTYRRKFQDPLIHCKQTFLHENVYKYDCENPDCECKVFMETLPFAKASQVRIDALNTLILAVSMFLSNEGVSKVLVLLGVQINNDTIQRLYARIEFVDNPDVEEIGVDDVAIRKGIGKNIIKRKHRIFSFSTVCITIKQAGIELIPANVLSSIPKVQKKPKKRCLSFVIRHAIKQSDSLF